MSELKKVTVSLPDSLLDEVEEIIHCEKTDYDEFAQRVLDFYVKNKALLSLEDDMAKGYTQMAKINLELAEEDMIAGNEALDNYINTLLGRGEND